MQEALRPSWRDWMVADAVAALAVVGIGGAVGSALLRLFEAGWFGVVSSTLAFALTGGGAFGILQHRALRDLFPFLKPGPWSTWTGVGFALAWLTLAFPIPGLSEDAALATAPGWWLSPRAVVVVSVAVGLIGGLCQAFALREWLPRPWRWVVVDTVAWSLAAIPLWWAAGPVTDSGPPVAPLAAAAVVLAGGGLVGLIQGVFIGRATSGNEDAGDYAQHILGDLGTIDLSE